MNLPELLGAGNALVTAKPKSSVQATRDEAGGASFLDSLSDASINAEGGERQEPDAIGEPSETAERTEDQASAIGVSSPEQKDQSDPSAKAAFAERNQSAETLLRATVPSASNQEAEASQNSSTKALTQNSQSQPNQSDKLQATPIATVVQNTSLQGKIVGAQEDKGTTLYNAPKETVLPGANGGAIQQAALTKQAGLISGKQRGLDTALNTNTPANATAKVTASATLPATGPTRNSSERSNVGAGKTIETISNADHAQLELETRDQKLADHEAQDQRRAERRLDASSAELRSNERNGGQSQLNANTVASNTRVTQGQVANFEIAHSGSTTQPFSSIGQTSTVREASVERNLMTTTSQVRDTPDFQRNTVSQIAAALKNQPLMKTIELSLDPPELGRIEIHMEVAEMGMRATLAAERSGTGDMIRRQVDLLLQQLDDAGFNNVSLDFREFGSGGQQNSQNEQQAASGAQEVNLSTEAPQVRHNAIRSVLSNGMDVRL